MSPQQQIIAKYKAVAEKASVLYGVDVRNVPLYLDMKGRTAGMANCKVNKLTGVSRAHLVRLNIEMIMRGGEAFEHILNNTIPHEIAHVVCRMNPKLGYAHDNGWWKICMALGGNGETTHDIKVIYGKGTTYEYTTDNGNKVRLNDKRHAYVQAGGTLKYRNGLGSVTSTCVHVVVGSSGRILPQLSKGNDMKTQENNVLAMAAATLVGNTAVAETPAADVATVGTEGLTITPVVKAPEAPKAPSKAEVSRGIMAKFYADGKAKVDADGNATPDTDAVIYEATIAEMQRVNGYDRQLARGTYKANYVKAKVPAPVEGVRPVKAVKPAATEAAAPVTTETQAPQTDAAPVEQKAEEAKTEDEPSATDVAAQVGESSEVAQ